MASAALSSSRTSPPSPLPPCPPPQANPPSPSVTLGQDVERRALRAEITPGVWAVKKQAVKLPPQLDSMCVHLDDAGRVVWFQGSGSTCRSAEAYPLAFTQLRDGLTQLFGAPVQEQSAPDGPEADRSAVWRDADGNTVTLAPHLEMAGRAAPRRRGPGPGRVPQRGRAFLPRGRVKIWLRKLRGAGRLSPSPVGRHRPGGTGNARLT